MNKNLTVLMILLSLLGCSFVAYAQNQSVPVTITAIEGKVEVQITQAQGWVPARAGLVVDLNSTISTGFRSKATVTIGASTITIQPLTRLTIQEASIQQGVRLNSTLYLATGSVAATVRGTNGQPVGMTVKSPVSTASVRGTQFEFDGKRLEVTEGTVEYETPEGEVVEVPIGEEVEVTESGEVLEFDELMEMEADTEIAFEDDLGFEDAGGGGSAEEVDWEEFFEDVDWEEYVDELFEDEATVIITIEGL